LSMLLVQFSIAGTVLLRPGAVANAEHQGLGAVASLQYSTVMRAVKCSTVQYKVF